MSSANNILYDLAASQPNEADFHGGAEYAKVVFRRIAGLVQNEKLSAFYDASRKMSNDVKALADKEEVELIAVCTDRDVQDLVSSGVFSRFYSALPYRYHQIDFSGVHTVFTIHGLRPIEQPTDTYEIVYCRTAKEGVKYVFKQILTERYREHKRRQVRGLLGAPSEGMEITVPSNHTKYSLLGNFPALNPEQIKILHSPIKELPPASETRRESQRLGKYSVQSRGFFLVTSARRWVKNAYRAVKAFDDLFSTFEGIEKKVLVLGVHENSRLDRGLANPDRFVFRGYLPAEDLNLLYRQAFAFVYPTLNEGFGYPPLESMRYGTPVLAAATSAVTEICGDAVLYFNPLDEGEIKNRALTILFDEEIWNRYSRKGGQRFEMIKERQEHMLDELCDLILGRC